MLTCCVIDRNVAIAAFWRRFQDEAGVSKDHAPGKWLGHRKCSKIQCILADNNLSIHVPHC